MDSLHNGVRALVPERHDPRAVDRLPDGRWAARYESLDIWRGLAAIGIVLHHVGSLDFGLSTGRVTIFFLISGYCIAASAESCMRRGISAGQFFWRRFHRIFPPYLLALLFWAVTRAIKIASGGSNDLDRSVLDWVQNITLTQWVSLLFNPQHHPGDNKTLFVAAFWSLCYEEQFYMVMTAFVGLVLAFPKTRMWALILMPLPLTIAWGMAFPTLVYGVFWEFWMSFGLGALVYYRLSVFSTARLRWAVDLLLIFVIVFSTIGWSMDERVAGAARSKWNEWLIAGTGGFALVLLRPLDRFVAGWAFLMPLRFIGRITYSLYLIHQFNITLVQSVVNAVLPASVREYSGVSLFFQVLGHIALATVFWFFCELPFYNKRVDKPAKAAQL